MADQGDAEPILAVVARGTVEPPAKAEGMMQDIPWAIVAPIVVIQLVLIVIALRDLIPRRETNGPKWVWAVVIVIFGVIGPVLYLTVGRKET